MKTLKVAEQTLGERNAEIASLRSAQALLQQVKRRLKDELVYQGKRDQIQG